MRFLPDSHWRLLNACDQNITFILKSRQKPAVTRSGHQREQKQSAPLRSFQSEAAWQPRLRRTEARWHTRLPLFHSEWSGVQRTSPVCECVSELASGCLHAGLTQIASRAEMQTNCFVQKQIHLIALSLKLKRRPHILPILAPWCHLLFQTWLLINARRQRIILACWLWKTKALCVAVLASDRIVRFYVAIKRRLLISFFLWLLGFTVSGAVLLCIHFRYPARCQREFMIIYVFLWKHVSYECCGKERKNWNWKTHSHTLSDRKICAGFQAHKVVPPVAATGAAAPAVA